MFDYNYLPYCNRATTRKVEKYRKKHPNLTFTQAYNKIFNTDYNERGSINIGETMTYGNNKKG